ncbi:MAG: aryl-sulfate sulfotransferase [Myxococcales bacterium]|nr:aryl-sulfate sulfotransferase [Myxococcales bacterium]
MVTARTMLRWGGAALLVLGLVAGGFAYGYLVHRNKLPPYAQIRKLAKSAGYRREARFTKAHPRIAEANRARLDREAIGGEPKAGAEVDAQTRQRLEALGYASGTELAEAELGVVAHNRERALPGLNLYSSGHDAEALLMDMDGRVLHRWKRSVDEVWPDTEVGENQGYFRRVALVPGGGGDLLVIYSGRGIVRLDRSSNVVWKLHNHAHHDLSLDAHGTIYVLGREAKHIPRVDPTQAVLEDFLDVLTPEGRRLEHISLLEAFERSRYAPTLRYLLRDPNPFHTNTVKILENTELGEPFLAGRVMLSMRELNTIAVLDPQRREIVWALNGQWHRQHEPTVLDSGHVLIFDNRGKDKMSRVLELDPATQQVVWSYGGEAENQFYSNSCGSARRLSNGNTLITESDRGRAFEVTPQREIVWEYLSPHRSPHREELVATLFEMTRVTEPQEWLQP